MHVTVTGGAGFIGANLCRALELAGHSVTAFDDLSTGTESNLDGTAAVVVFVPHYSCYPRFEEEQDPPPAPLPPKVRVWDLVRD